MRYKWLDEYLMRKKGVEKNLKVEWNWMRYCIGDKMFAAILLDRNDIPYFINIKVDPQESMYLRDHYKDIVPGYYSNKVHWISINPDGEVPDDLMEHLLDEAYKLVLAKFSKKKQREILNA